MRKKLLAALSATAFVVGCATQCQPVPVPPSPSYGGSAGSWPVPVGGYAGAPQGGQGGAAATGGTGPAECIDPADACDRAGCRLALLDCPERATPKGTPATVVCHQKAAEGRPWPTTCIIQSESCEAARACR